MALVTSPDLLSSAAAAKQLGVNRSTLTRWVAAERITPVLTVPGYRGDFLFDPADVETLAAERAS